MNKYASNFFMSLIGVAAATLAAGCGDDPPGSTTPGSGGGTSAEGVTLIPSADGWIDATDVGNTIGVQGAWYPYGDQYGAEMTCIAAGHPASACSVITTPDPNTPGFPNTAGKMCTAGTAAQVLPMVGGTEPDYSNIWGGGIGLDFNNTGEAGGSMKLVYNAPEKGVTGISFILERPPLAGLRVEFPQTDTEGSADGNDYWGATMTYPPSPVKEGLNTVKWSDGVIVGPRGHAFNAANLLGIQFHVPSSTSAAGVYDFCISELTFLTE